MKKSLAMIAAVALAACSAAAQGGLRYSITVTKFDNKANWSGQWDLGDAWGTILTDSLTQSGRFIVLGESDMRNAALAEQDMVAAGRSAGGKKAPQKGNMTPAQLLVKGAITHVEENKKSSSGGFSFRGINIGGSGGSAEINITIYIVDSQTGQVKASKSVVGKSGAQGLDVGYSGHSLGGLTGGLGGFEKDNMGKATADAVNQAVAFLVAQLDSIPWEGTVVLAKPDKVIINRGSREGVAVGQVFDVGKVEILTDPDSGEKLDEEMKKVGTITVATVKDKVAICTPTSGSGFEKGMSVHPAK